ncbi:MAG: ABC-2 family transporter protein [Planctomycetota bacterium]|nr:ABC-2 family transporter protein [Planctomycetota bacterium]MDA1214313.1 ABC-2 family transporter protein [Planctomycetota bacterium]
MIPSTLLHYLQVFKTLCRISLVREMMFRSNFLITVITRLFWFTTQIVLFEIIYRNIVSIKDWNREEYFAFMATGSLINALVETIFMPNCANFSEQIRTGNLDFVLLKPLDTQFLVSFEKIDFAMMNQVLFSLGLLGYSLVTLGRPISAEQVLMYLLLITLGVTFFYSLMLILASTSVWFVRNQGLYDFWFYLTVFARYPMSIYSGTPTGEVIRALFGYVIPILLVVTVPARILLSKTLEPNWITAVSIAATAIGLVASRTIFLWSLRNYSSASS